MLSDKLLAALTDNKMLRSGHLAVVAVSGGPDSVALLHSLSSECRTAGVRLHVAHLDHMLRSPQSADDAAYVSALASGLGWPVTVEACDVASMRAIYRMTLEEAGRIARYSFFDRLVRQIGAVGVFVGHTADDQVETVLLHLVRGTGPGGLRGMRPVSDLHFRDKEGRYASLCVMRPLLQVTRSEVEVYCADHDLRPRRDSSNTDMRFLRNRIRTELLPSAYRCNPGFGEAVRRLSHIMAADDDFLQTETARLWQTTVQEREGLLVFDLERWRVAPRSIQYRLLREGVRRLLGDIHDVSVVHLDGAIEAITSRPAGTIVMFPRGVRLVKRYSDFLLSLKGHREPALSLEGEPVAVPGVSVIGKGRWRVAAQLVPSRGHPARNDGLHADLDAESVNGQISVRRRRAGDRFQPLGLAFEKKVQDVFVDAKVPREERDHVPIVTTGDRIVWLGGERIAEWAKVRDSSRTTLCLRFEPINPAHVRVDEVD